MRYRKGRLLLRTKYGKYKGVHKVYLDYNVWRKEYRDTPLVRQWWLAEKGDWLMADDGTVAKCLDAYVMPNKRPACKPTRVIRVAWGSYPRYERKDGTSSARMTYDGRKRSNAHGVGSMCKYDNPRHGKSMTKRKKKFAYLCIARQMTPYRAYMIAFGTLSVEIARYESTRLLSDEKDALMKEVAQMYRDHFDSSGLASEDIAREITEMVKNSKATKDKIAALKLALQLRGEVSAGININNNLGAGVNIPLMGSGPKPPPALTQGLSVDLPELDAHVFSSNTRQLLGAVLSEDDGTPSS